MAAQVLISPKVVVKLTATVQNTMDDGRIATGPLSLVVDDTLVSGVENNAASRAWQWIHRDSDPKVLLSGANLVIDIFDLAGFDMGAGDGNDIVGQPLQFEEVVSIFIKNGNAIGAAGQLEIIPDPAQGWTPIGIHTVALGGALRGQGILFKYQPNQNGFDVTDGVNHRIRLTAVGGNVNLEIAILGRHDDEASSSSSSSSSSVSSSSSSSSVSSSSPSSSSSVSSSSPSSSSVSSSSSSSISSSVSSESSSSSISSSVSSESSSSSP